MRRDPINELRHAIDSLPTATRTAMLEGIRTKPIIVGAYTDNRGGICPMLAAHRNGGRTTLLSFARSWDRYTNARRVRRASHRELAVLERLLLQSLATSPDNPGEVDLGAAIAEHQRLAARRRRAPKPQPEEQIRAARLAPGRIGRIRPRRADAERALARLDQHQAALTR